MIDKAAANAFDPNSDPARLARIGAHVATRLDADPRVQQIDLVDAQAYV